MIFGKSSVWNVCIHLWMNDLLYTLLLVKINELLAIAVERLQFFGTSIPHHKRFRHTVKTVRLTISNLPHLWTEHIQGDH